MKKLIFTEGISGVGKSMLAQKLCDKLREQGFSIDCYFEFNFTNPIDFYCTTHFKQNEYADLLVEHKKYSEDIKLNTIIAEDIRLIQYYNRETPLVAEPLLDALSKHEFC